MYIDYLADNTAQPLWVLLNSKITPTGLVPEIVCHYVGEFNDDTLTLYDKNNLKICEVAIASSFKEYLYNRQGLLTEPLLITNTDNEEFKLISIDLPEIIPNE